MYCVPTRDLLH